MTQLSNKHFVWIWKINFKKCYFKQNSHYTLWELKIGYWKERKFGSVISLLLISLPQIFYPAQKLQISSAILEFISIQDENSSKNKHLPLLTSPASRAQPKFTEELNRDGVQFCKFTDNQPVTCMCKLDWTLVVKSLFCLLLLSTVSKSNSGGLLLSRHSLLKVFMFLKNLDS